jgi:hypothetical protein
MSQMASARLTLRAFCREKPNNRRRAAAGTRLALISLLGQKWTKVEQA